MFLIDLSSHIWDSFNVCVQNLRDINYLFWFSLLQPVNSSLLWFCSVIVVWFCTLHDLETFPLFCICKLYGTCSTLYALWDVTSQREIKLSKGNENSNMTSFFRFVNKRAIYRLCIISLAHAPVHVTDFPVVNVHVGELSSARIWPNKLCATYSANVNINNRLPMKVYYRICTCTLRHQNRNKWFFLPFISLWKVFPYLNIYTRPLNIFIADEAEWSMVSRLRLVLLCVNNMSSNPVEGE